MFQVIKTEEKARRGTFTCAHGVVQTPVFMNVGTQGAIKGAVSAHDLREIGCQVELSNTYHLHLRPGDDVVKAMGGLHRFMRWDGPMLTDSGGFQVFSLAGLRNITEEGVTFASHIDGHKIFMGPEESMRIQSNLGSDIAMAFDECMENPAEYDYAKRSCERTLRWLERCKAEHDRLNALPDCVNPKQMLFGINQGATYPDLRVWHMQETAKIDCDGYAIGGLAVGEPTEVMYQIIEAVEPHMPADKPRYLMGVGTPSNIMEGVARGIDFFDCVMPARNARHGGAVDRHLVGSGGEQSSRVLDRCDAAADGERNIDALGDAGDQLGECAPAFLRRADVEVDQLVGSLFGVASPQFDRVTHVLQTEKVDPLDGLSVLDVEAGYDAFG